VITAIEAQRNELDYDLDGAVLRLADRDAYAAAGTRSNSPRDALAFKFAAEEKTTVLADVAWDVGKTGKIAPVAWLEPTASGSSSETEQARLHVATSPTSSRRPDQQVRTHSSLPPWPR
jgi:DNA ligase (NAD+)